MLCITSIDKKHKSILSKINELIINKDTKFSGPPQTSGFMPRTETVVCKDCKKEIDEVFIRCAKCRLCVVCGDCKDKKYIHHHYKLCKGKYSTKSIMTDIDGNDFYFGGSKFSKITCVLFPKNIGGGIRNVTRIIVIDKDPNKLVVIFENTNTILHINYSGNYFMNGTEFIKALHV